MNDPSPLAHDLIKNARPATVEQIEAQRRGYAASAAIPGERQAVPLTSDDPRWNEVQHYHVKRDGSDDTVYKTLKARPYASIDIETTGTEDEWCQVLEVGVVIDDWVSPIASLPQFHCYVVHDRIVGQPFALAMNAEILRRIDRRNEPENKDFLFLQPGAVGGELNWFFAQHGLGQTRETSVIPAGKNYGGFDKLFLRRLPDFNEIKFCHRVIEPGMLYWNPWIDAEPPSSKTCKERSGHPGEIAHTAIADAIDIIQMVRNAHGRTVHINNEGKVTGEGGRKLTAREIAEGLTERFIRNGQFTK